MRVATVAFVVAGMVVGCGGGETSPSDQGSNTGRSDHGSNASVYVRDIQPGAQQRADAMMLQLADLPAEWTSSASDPSDEQTNENFLRCIGVDFTDLTEIGDADSKDFKQGDASQVSSNGSIFKTDAEAKTAGDRYAAALTGPKAADCFEGQLHNQLEKDPDTAGKVKIGDIELGELNVTPPSGIRKYRAVRVRIAIEVQNISIDLFADDVVMQQGDAVVEVTTTAHYAPLDSTLRDQLVQTVASRMSNGGSAETATGTAENFVRRWPSLWCSAKVGMSRSALHSLMGPPTEPDSGKIPLIPHVGATSPPEPQGSDTWQAPGSYQFNAFYDPALHVQQLDFNGPKSALPCSDSRVK
jgi:hypothetical protein